MRRRIVLLACGVVLVAPLTYILLWEFAVLRRSDVVGARDRSRPCRSTR